MKLLFFVSSNPKPYNIHKMETAFDKAYAGLNVAQRKAVETIDGPVLVIAGPGTGKTQLLSVRVASILRKTDINASNILCLTFTESGQQAIQKRLLELVGETANKVTIHTFHGFGSSVISANSDMFYDAVQSRPADDLTLFEILHGLFEQLPHGGPLSSQNNEEFVFLKNTQERISQLKTAGITPDHLRQILTDDGVWCKLATPLIQKTFASFSRISKKYLPLFEELAYQLDKLPKNEGTMAWLKPLAISCISELRVATEEANATGKTTGISEWRKKWLENVNEVLSLKAIAQHERLEVLADIYEKYVAALRERHLFDYDDMILSVVDTLETHPELKASLQEQFQYILVDEYQDTNGVQARLLELMADNPVNEGRPNMMVVGDDDQAIYGFQGADANVMLRFREHWRDVKVIVLTDNYRSTQPILDVSRQLITQGQQRLENYYPDIVKKLVAKEDHTGPNPHLVMLEDEISQYYWLIEKLKVLKNTGLELDTVAIIAPRHKYLQRLLPYLQNAQIDLNYERRSNVLKEPLTLQFIQLCRLVSAIAKEKRSEAQSLLPEVLSYDWWQIPPQVLWSMSLLADRDSQEGWLEAMVDSDQEELVNAAAWLADTSDMSKTDSLEAVLDNILEFLSDKLEIKDLQISVSAIIRGLSQYRPDETLQLHDFVRYINLCQQANIGITANEITETGKHAVRLLTAHKAKGLEFSHVIIINASEHVWLKEKGMINKVSLPPNLSIQPPGETNDDKLRLLYVALTRAERSLTLSVFEKASDGRVHAPATWLTAAGIETHNQSSLTTDSKTQFRVESESIDWRNVHHLQLASPSARSFLQPYLERYRLSPTHLTSFLDVTRGGPSQFLVRHLLQFPEAISTNMIFGNGIHLCLEYAQKAVNTGNELPAVIKLMDYFIESLQAYSLTGNERAKLVNRAQRCLKHYMDQQATSFTANSIPEQHFRNENILLGKARLTGKVDRLSLQSETKAAIITDFKTGRSFSKWQASPDYDKHKLYKFEQQLMFYKILVEKSSQFKSHIVTEGFLDFVEPDKWGRIISLPYDYDKQKQTRLEQLIAVVWNKIITLDLPDTSEYTQDFTGVKAFEQDLLDGVV